MSQQNTLSTKNKGEVKNTLIAGLILMGIGIGLLLLQFTDLAMYIPLLIGTIFLVAGIISRKAGLLIPGGIVSGVGIGALSIVQGWLFPTDSVESGGVFLLFFSLGWFLIPLLSRIFTNETNIWALIPGSILAAIGGLILLGQQGLRILELAGKFWPIILVVIGAAMLLGLWRERK